MSDEFLHGFRKDPKPEFADKLFQRIDQPMKEKPFTLRVLTNWKTAFAAVAAVAVVALVVSPSARALAQDFLNLFRVQRFAAVTVDPARIQQLSSGTVDIQSLFSASTKVIKEPGEPQVVTSPDAAGKLAGFTVRVPSVLPDGVSLERIYVQGEGTMQFKAENAKLQAVLDELSITDVKIPAALDGQVVTVDKPPVVVLSYQGGRDHVLFMQSHNPQIELPDGVDMAQLGEIALRVAGMSQDEAHRFAQSIDWSSTLLVPVSANATSFREVDVRGAKGLLIASNGSPVPMTQYNKEGARQVPPTSTLMWAEGDMVYAISGTGTVALVDIANSLH